MTLRAQPMWPDGNGVKDRTRVGVDMALLARQASVCEVRRLAGRDRGRWLAPDHRRRAAGPPWCMTLRALPMWTARWHGVKDVGWLAGRPPDRPPDGRSGCLTLRPLPTVAGWGNGVKDVGWLAGMEATPSPHQARTPDG